MDVFLSLKSVGLVITFAFSGITELADAFGPTQCRVLSQCSALAMGLQTVRAGLQTDSTPLGGGENLCLVDLPMPTQQRLRLAPGHDRVFHLPSHDSPQAAAISMLEVIQTASSQVRCEHKKVVDAVHRE